MARPKPMAKPATPAPQTRDWLRGLLLLAATLAAYQPAWHGQPLWDDDVYLTPPGLRSLHGLAEIWADPSRTKQYYPLTHSVLWLQDQLWGQSMLGYHLLNILLHVACAIVFARILRKLRVPGAWLAGGLFALHPVMVESVAWISEIKNTLSGVFFLGATLVYLQFDGSRGRRPYLLALGLFVCGLFAKTTIVMLPVALLVVLWWMRGRVEWKRDVVPLLPFLAVAAALGTITTWVEHQYVDPHEADFGRTLVERLLIAGRAVWFYLYKILWPADLILVYPRWHVDATAAWQYLFPAALLLAAALFWKLRKRSRAPLAVLLYFVAALFPALGFVDFYFSRYSFVADHLQYLAALGPLAVVAALIAKGAGLMKEGVRTSAGPVLSGVLLAALWVLSWRQSGLYSSPETMYRATIAGNADCWMAHNNLGILLDGMGRKDEARGYYTKALEFSPTRADAHYNLGLLAEGMGQKEEAFAHYRQALDANPDHAKAHNNLGVLLRSRGETDEALAHYRKASQIDPNFANVHHNLGNLLEAMGRPDEGMAHYRKALELDPNLTDAHYNLAFLLAKMGRADEAMAQYRKALERNPSHVDAHNNLGILLAQQGRVDEAILHFRAALEADPQAVRIMKNLGFAHLQKGQLAEASSVLQTALTLAKSAGDDEQMETLAQILAKVGTAHAAPDPTAPAR